MATTSDSPVDSPTMAPRPDKFAQKFFATLASSPTTIVFTCLVGAGILLVLVGLLFWIVRSWYNRRRQSKMDEDTWRFLEAPDELRCHFIDLQTQPSVQSFIDEQCRTGFLVEQDISLLAPPAPIPTRYNNTGMASTVAKVDRAILSNAMCSSESSRDSQESNLTNLPPALGGKYTRHSSIALPSYKSEQDRMIGTQNHAYKRAALARNLNNRATMYVSSVQAPAPKFRPASVYTPLARQSSLACSEQSTTLEALREDATDRRTRLGANLRDAIQRERELEDEEFLESLKILWNEKRSRNDHSIILQTPEMPSTHDIPSSNMQISLTEGSCYSVASDRIQ